MGTNNGVKTCNQCHKELKESWRNPTGRWLENKWIDIPKPLAVCANPVCPNYGIVQVPAEDMPKEESDDNKR